MTTEPTNPLAIPQLVESGDWACTHHDPEVLSDVAHLLCLGMASSLQTELMAIEQLARTDLEAAGHRWVGVARCLRDWMAASSARRS
jgi:hypothetical protein